MRHIFTFNTHSLHFRYVGVAAGGYCEKYSEAAIVDKNLQQVKAWRAVTAVTRAKLNYIADAQIVTSAQEEVGSDAFITTTKGHALVMGIADCVPLLVYHPRIPILALIHGSRRALNADIISHTLRQLSDHTGAPIHQFHAYLGPGIKSRSYILPRSIVTELNHKAWREFVQVTGDDVRLDMYGFCQRELTRHGIARIGSSRIDTATNSRYYSHYRATRHGDTQGRNGCVAVLL